MMSIGMSLLRGFLSIASKPATKKGNSPMTEATLSDLPKIFDFSTARSEAAKAVMMITSEMTEGITDPRIRRVSVVV